jgi:hypothetical protein
MAKVTLRVGDPVIVRCNEPKLKGALPAKLVALTSEPGKIVGVEFNEDIGGHSCDGAGLQGHCMWILPENIFTTKEAEELRKLDAVAKTVAAPKKPMVLEVGDGVKAIKPL